MADDEDTGAPEVAQEEGRSDAEWESLVARNEQAATAALNAGRGVSALGQLLEDPPTRCKNQAIKDRAAEAVLKILVSVKEAQVKQAVDGLSAEQIDVLIKYVYRHLGTGENSNILLKWHECCFEKGGLGCIVRVLAERHGV